MVSVSFNFLEKTNVCVHVGVRERPCLLIIRFCALVVCMYVEGPCRVKGGYGVHIFSSLCRKGGEAPQDYSDLLTVTEEYRHRWHSRRNRNTGVRVSLRAPFLKLELC